MKSARSRRSTRRPRVPILPPEDPTPRPLIPNDHVRLLIGLMQPMGAELVRRWVSALMLVHPSEREAVVAAVERQLTALYPLDDHDQTALDKPAAPTTSTRRTKSA